MNLILAALSDRMLDSWTQFFGGQAQVSILQADITRVTCDAVVSPANSFGFMDGGLDHALSERFGWDLEKRLQQQIRELPMGELLIGQALALSTGDPQVPWLISAPTMRIPTNFNIASSVNAYLAMKAALIQARSIPEIQTLAVPGLCTGVGRMHPMIAARQMWIAYREIILGERHAPPTFADAQKYHWDINPQGGIWET